MINTQKSLWKACFGVLLVALIIIGYLRYPDYDTTQERAQLLSTKDGAEVEIVDEIPLEDLTICQLRLDGRIGYAVFHDFLGKTKFQQMGTTSSDRSVRPIDVGGKPWLILICDQPEVHHAVIYYWNENTHGYTAGEPIDMDGRQILVIPHDPESGTYGYTEYYDADENML